MPITFADYSPEHATAVEACNGRLIEGGVEAGFLLPARALEPVPAGRAIQPRWRLAVDGDVAAGGAVRGGYLLKTQRFLAGGSPVSYTHLTLPTKRIV